MELNLNFFIGRNVFFAAVISVFAASGASAEDKAPVAAVCPKYNHTSGKFPQYSWKVAKDIKPVELTDSAVIEIKGTPYKVKVKFPKTWMSSPGEEDMMYFMIKPRRDACKSFATPGSEIPTEYCNRVYIDIRRQEKDDPKIGSWRPEPRKYQDGKGFFVYSPLPPGQATISKIKFIQYSTTENYPGSCQISNALVANDNQFHLMVHAESFVSEKKGSLKLREAQTVAELLEITKSLEIIK